jgi:DNA-directed RNA polymerase specialized sigma24 family protein
MLPDAPGQVYTKLRQRAENLSRRYRLDSDDVSQAAYVAYLASAASGAGEDAALAAGFAGATRYVSQERTCRRRHVEAHVEAYEAPPPDTGPDWDRVGEVLTRRQRAVVTLRRQGYTDREIASQLGISRVAVCRCRHRAMERIRRANGGGTDPVGTVQK